MFYGVRADGTKPAEEFLADLRRGDWRDDPDHAASAGWPDEAQPGDRAMLVQIIRNFADDGKPRRAAQVNVLEEGVWEFKRASKRVTFWDTDGSGSCVTRSKIDDIENAHRGPDDPMWKFPDFEQQLRLGHCFGKTGERTDPQDIQVSIVVKEEDLSYDRAA
ncbi:hypothetical protein E9228_002801 [Curtobacterium flaccumfaciens]|uniref:ASCH domain-containing protein n=1 Tax=Curtobacterium salicis TaxID=1779862 RepID=A0ABX0TB59_9MICO|nr:hypothetical protein [Curtobacterium sp. WW7]NII42143.1 hypothetical protein [Curtobacterium sp. WW7]